MYLLDTDVMSLTSPASQMSGLAVARWRNWVLANSNVLHFSAITLMEFRFGVENLRAKGALQKAATIDKWLLITETLYRDRIAWISPEIAHKAGEMLSFAVSSGHRPSAEDALIAATAAVRGMRLVSRNLRHMNALGSDCLDPLSELPSAKG